MAFIRISKIHKHSLVWQKDLHKFKIKCYAIRTKCCFGWLTIEFIWMDDVMVGTNMNSSKWSLRQTPCTFAPHLYGNIGLSVIIIYFKYGKFSLKILPHSNHRMECAVIFKSHKKPTLASKNYYYSIDQKFYHFVMFGWAFWFYCKSGCVCVCVLKSVSAIPFDMKLFAKFNRTLYAHIETFIHFISLPRNIDWENGHFWPFVRWNNQIVVSNANKNENK